MGGCLLETGHLFRTRLLGVHSRVRITFEASGFYFSCESVTEGVSGRSALNMQEKNEAKSEKVINLKHLKEIFTAES